MGSSGMLEETESYRRMKNLIESAILWFIAIIFVGYVLIWVMMPTNTFHLHWFPAIHWKTESTYFGEQGWN